MNSGSDKDLELLRSKKFIELQKKLQIKKENIPRKENSPREIVVSRLYDRGEEVLKAAEIAYPKETRLIIKKLSELIQSKSLGGYISGGELLWLFRNIGMRINIETNIMVEDHGKLFSLKEVLKSKSDRA